MIRLALTAVLLAHGPAFALAPSFVPINGAGSTWSAPAVTQWASNVKQYGMQIGFADTGSTDGRKQFANGTVEFGVSEIPYGLADSATRDVDPPPTTARPFAYMPIVAGGTSFMYNLKIGGQRVTNLRLSGEVVTKIFTNVITQWNDPAIKKDNPNLALPARKIVPVVRSDGSGTSAQFTLWMSKQYPALWNDFCAKHGRSQSPCGLTSYFPVISGKNVGQSGSLGVAGYVSQPQYEGSITYVEYAYALQNHFPVAKVLNKAGYYIEPTANAVAVALTKAEIAADLTQRLDNVYTQSDKRAYPLSSYSYMIVPVDQLKMGFTEDKGYTLASFAYYFLCEGQQQADTLGYSPLPINLVKAGITQVKRIPGAANKNVDIAGCHNPTFSSDGTNTLATKAPNPPDCDKAGPVQCAAGTGGAKTNTTLNNGANTTGNGTGAGSASAGPSASAAAQIVDPDTGETRAADDPGGGADVAGVPVSLEAEGSGLRRTLMVLAGLLFAVIVIGPPVLTRLLRGRRDGGA